MPKRVGRKSAAQTPAPKSDIKYGSKVNKVGSASASESKNIQLSEKTLNTLKEKLAEFKKKHPNNKSITLSDLKAVYRRGSGAYSKSHRPTITGGAPNTRAAWSFARVNKFLLKAGGTKVKAAYVQDDDLMEKGGLIAPNGKKSNLTPEQYKLVRTPEFKAWFGDWENDPENASKVVDDNGEPMVVYHGSRKKAFTEFKNYFERKKIAIPNDRIKLHFFTNDRNSAKDYGTKNIYECFLSMKNPLYYKTSDGTPEQAIIQQNKDGFILKSSSSVFGVPKSNQIKLADGTNTKFDTNNPDIRYKDGGLLKSLEIGGQNLNKNGIVLSDYDNKIIVIAYNSGNQERNASLYNKALIYKSIRPIRQANEIIERLDNNEFENFDERKIDEYKKSNQLIILNQNEVLYDSENQDGGLIAPNGKKSNLTPEQYKLVRTPEFKAWFGDWENDPENASKVVDENGEPMVLLRGNNITNQNLGYVFELGKNFLKKKNGNNFGFFFTDEIGVAKRYADIELYPEVIEGNILSVFVKSNKILDLTNFGIKIWQESFIQGLIEKGINFDGFENLVDKIKNFDSEVEGEIWGNYVFDYFDVFPDLRMLFIKNGFTSVIFLENSRYHSYYKVYVAFESNQIKLADGTNTTFDANNPDIRFKRGGTTFNDKELLAKWKKGESIGFTGVAHLKAKGLIPRADGTKRKSEKYMEHGGEVTISNEDYDFFVGGDEYFGKAIKQNGVTVGGIEYDEDEIKGIEIKNKFTKKGLAKKAVKALFEKNPTLKSVYVRAVPKAKAFWEKIGTKFDNYNQDAGLWEGTLKKYEHGGEIGQDVVCENCGWEWNTVDSDEKDKYVCHKCGFDNTLFYSDDIFARGGKTKGGDCYVKAGSFCLLPNMHDFIGEPYLVHAEVRGQGKIEGLRYGHAWVEDDENVYDYSNGREIVMPKQVYYLLGDIKTDNPKKYQRYSFPEARAKMLKTKHYGSWDIETDYKDGGIVPKVLYHYTNDKIPVISTHTDRLVPNSLSTSANKKDWSFWGKNLFEITLPENAKMMVIDKNNYWKYGKETDTQYNRGKEIYKEAKKNKIDVIYFKKMVQGLDEYAVLNKDFKYKKILTPDKEATISFKEKIKLESELLRAAALAEIAAKQKAKTKKFEKGGEFNPDDKKTKDMITHKSGSAGGMLVGNRHSEGGIKAINKASNTPLEMEGGEVVITRNAVSDDKKHEFEGEMLTNREILSKINESGGGVSFAKGGDIMSKFKKPMSIKEIQDEYGVDSQYLENQLEIGTKHELEHTNDKEIAKIIALHHLAEKPNYYELVEKYKLEQGGQPSKFWHKSEKETYEIPDFIKKERIATEELLCSSDTRIAKAIICRAKIDFCEKKEANTRNLEEKNAWSEVKHIWESCLQEIKSGVEYEYKDGGECGCSSSKKYKNGGLAYGNSHDKGGMPLKVQSTGQSIEIEGGEGVVNKRSMQIKKRIDFEGKKLTPCQIVSKINQMGGGVKFKCDDVAEILEKDGSF